MMLFPKIVLLSSTLYGSLAVQLFNNFKPENTDKDSTDDLSESWIDVKRKKFQVWFQKYTHHVLVGYWLVSLMIAILLMTILNYKNYELTTYYILSDTIFIVLLLSAVRVKDSVLKTHPILVAVFLIIFIGQRIGSYSAIEAQELKAGIVDRPREVKFTYNQKQIQSNRYHLVVGQTSTHLFLYHIKFKRTEVYPIDKIEDLFIMSQ